MLSIFKIEKFVTSSESAFPVVIRCIVVKSVLMPIFKYVDVVFAISLNSCSKNILFRSLNACVRFTFGIGKYDSVSHFVSRILGCSLLEFYDHRCCSFLFQFTKRRNPPYLSMFFKADRLDQFR